MTMPKHITEGLKAYNLSIQHDDYAGNAIVFAKNVSGAKKQIYGTELADHLESYIYVRANRAPRYDGMENLSAAELACKQWRDGWMWFDISFPDVETTTDEEFLKWYAGTFGARKTI